MFEAIGSALSGLRAAITQLDVSANNVANSDTDGFKASEAVNSEGPGGGVVVNVVTTSREGALRVEDGEEVVASNVNLVEETVDQIIAEHSVGVNGAVIKTAQETEEHLLDLFA